MSFLAEDPLLRGQEQQSRQPNYIQGDPVAQSQPGIGTQLAQKAAMGLATEALGTAAIPFLGPVAGLLPMLFNQGTSSVPSQDFGPDPLAMGYNNGTKRVPGYNNGSRNVDKELTPDQLLFQQAEEAMQQRKLNENQGKGYITDDQVSPFFKFLRAYNPFQYIHDEKEPMISPYLARDQGTFKRMEMRGYNDGSMGVKPTTNMSYAGGTDSVPAMLTPKEAVIPAPAAQDPTNKPIIEAMINEGRAANQMAQGGPMQAPQQATPEMAGPLSGKGQREQMKLLQEMSLKKKAWEADEQRKQIAFNQKMSQDKMKADLAMRQSQE
jgi:hypothetical protein